MKNIESILWKLEKLENVFKVYSTEYFRGKKSTDDEMIELHSEILNLIDDIGSDIKRVHYGS